MKGSFEFVVVLGLRRKRVSVNGRFPEVQFSSAWALG